MKLTYSRPADVLTLEDEEYLDFDRSMELDGMTIDLSTDDDCLGLQIHDLAERTGLDPDQIDTLTEEDIHIKVETDPGLTVTATIHHNGNEYTLTAGSRQQPQAEDARGQ